MILVALLWPLHGDEVDPFVSLLCSLGITNTQTHTPNWRQIGFGPKSSAGHLISLANRAQIASGYNTLDGRGDSTTESNDDDLERD